MKHLILSTCLILLLNLTGVSQYLDISKIEEAKSKLKNLQSQLWQVDAGQRKETKLLNKNSEIKSEFETTKQFEERAKKLEENIWEIESQILRKRGISRETVQKKINELLSTKFIGQLEIKLSQFDADNQRYTIFSKDEIAFNYFAIPTNEARLLKENVSEAKISGDSAILLDEYNEASEYLLFLKIEFRDKLYEIPSQNLTEVKAMQMVFGNYNFNTKKSTWRTYKTESDFDGNMATEKLVLTKTFASPILFRQFRENGIEKYLLVANTELNKDEEMDFSCHVCYGLPSIATFIKTDKDWKVETAQKHAGEIGYYGSPGEPSLVKIGKEKFGVKFSWSDFHMGYGKGGEYYWTIIDGTLKEIFNIYTSEDNTESGEPIKDRITYNSKIVFVPSNDLEFFDAKVITTGKKGEKIGRRFILKPFTKTEIYHYTNGKYELVK